MTNIFSIFFITSQYFFPPHTLPFQHFEFVLRCFDKLLYKVVIYKLVIYKVVILSGVNRKKTCCFIRSFKHILLLLNIKKTLSFLLFLRVRVSFPLQLNWSWGRGCIRFRPRPLNCPSPMLTARVFCEHLL